MRFLVDANLPRRVTEVLRARGHEVIDVRDTDLRAASDAQIAARARTQQLCLLTRDLGFGDIRAYPPADYSGIVVLNLPSQAGAELIGQTVAELLKMKELLEALPGRLAVVQPGQVRLR